MESRDQALTVIQRPERIHAPLKAEIQMQIHRPGGMLLQNRERQIVAGPDGEELVARVTRIADDVREIRAQRFDVRLHPDPGAPLCPHQSLGEFGRACFLPLSPTDQRLTERLLPLADRAPHITIGASECPGGMGDGAAVGDSTQQLKERIAQGSAVLLPYFEPIPKVNTQVVRRNFTAATLLLRFRNSARCIG